MVSNSKIRGIFEIKTMITIKTIDFSDLDIFATYTNSPYIGAIVRFTNLKGKAAIYRNYFFEIVAFQVACEYDEQGRYMLVEVCRVVLLIDGINFSCAVSFSDIEVLTTYN